MALLRFASLASLAATAAGVTGRGRLVEDILADEVPRGHSLALQDRLHAREASDPALGTERRPSNLSLTGPGTSVLAVSARGRFQGVRHSVAGPRTRVTDSAVAAPLVQQVQRSPEGAVVPQLAQLGAEASSKDCNFWCKIVSFFKNLGKSGGDSGGSTEESSGGDSGTTSDSRRRRTDDSSRRRSGDGLGGGGTYKGDLKISSEGYKLVWSDNFDKDGGVDTSKWEQVNKGGGFGNREKQFYSNRKDNAEIKDGILYIKAKKESFSGHQYTSAKLKSKEQWLYGKMIVRSRNKQAKARGTWGAHWMMPRSSGYGTWPKSGEIDIMEYVGYGNDKIYGTVHTGAYNHIKGTQKGGQLTVDIGDWHNYTAEWKEDMILFACDSTVYQVFKRESTSDKMKWPFDKPFYVILNLAVGGNWGGQKGIDAAAFGGEGQIMEIDFVEVWQKK